MGLSTNKEDRASLRIVLSFGFHRALFNWGVRSSTSWLSVVTLAFLISTACSGAAEYQGSGYVDYRAFSPDTNEVGRTVFEQRWNFVFGSSNALWRIHLEDSEQRIQVDYSYDGTNTYVAIPTGTNLATQIFPTQHPPPNGWPAVVVWFAYCSGAYINGVRDNLLCSLGQEAHPSMTAYDRPVRSELEMLDGPLRIPQKCIQFSDGARYAIDVTKRPPVTVGLRYGGVFSDGFVRAVYTAGGTTNAGGLILPKTFRLQEFRPRAGSSSSNDVFVIAEFEGFLQSASPGKSDIGGGVRVEPDAIVGDYRGMKMDPPVELVQYQSPSNTWLPFSPGSMPYTIYESKRLVQGTLVARSRNQKAIVVAVLALLAAAPFIVIWGRRLFVGNKS